MVFPLKKKKSLHMETNSALKRKENRVHKLAALWPASRPSEGLGLGVERGPARTVLNFECRVQILDAKY